MSTIKLCNSTGQETTSLDIGVAIDSKVVSPKIYSCAVRVLLQNWRQGTVGHKSRGQVSFSGKKPWRQKGTGRARAGTARSPIWRSGGVTFGPEPRVRTLKMNRKQRRVALKGLFQSMIDSALIYCAEFDLSTKKVPKTKEASLLLKGLGVDKKKGVLFLPHDDVANFSAFRNIASVGVLSFDQPNVFDLSGTHYWMFLKKDLELFKNMVEKWT